MTTTDSELDRFELLASAIAGSGIRLDRTTKDGKTYTDGRTIYVEQSQEPARDVAALVVQSALIAAGSLHPKLLRRMVGRPGICDRYLAIEGWRALATVPSLPPVPLVQTARARCLGGGSPEDSLRAALGKVDAPPLPEEFGALRPRRVLSTDPPTGDAPSAADQARQELALEVVAADDDSDEKGREERERLGSLAKLFRTPMTTSLLTRAAKRAGFRRQPGEGGGGGELPVGSARIVAAVGEQAAPSLLPGGLPREVGFHDGVGGNYPEWDTHENRFRPGWCTVRETDPIPADGAAIDPPASRELRRRISRLGVGLERTRRQVQGDAIDIDAAVESRVQFLAGATPGDGLYIDSQRRRRSLAVLVLLDISGSAAGGTAGSVTIHERQTAAAFALMEAHHYLGDRVALYGFHSRGRGYVQLVRVKAFDDTIDQPMRDRLAGLRPGAFTRLGAAVRHGTQMLKARGGMDHRLLVVISDGFPYDEGYESSYAEADARHALAEARRTGVGCLCLTLGAGTEPDALARVFGTAAHASAPELEDLYPTIERLFRQAIASADMQRKISQRHRASSARSGAT